MNTDYLNLLEARFKKNFPKSHLIISFERSIHYSGTTTTWYLYIVFDELIDEDLDPTKIFEQFDTFTELDNRLSFLMQREATTIEGIKVDAEEYQNTALRHVAEREEIL